MESKSFQLLRSRVEYLRQHLELLDAALTHTDNQLKLDCLGTKQVSEVLNVPNHSSLNHPTTERKRLIRYSRSKNAEYSIIELYKYFTEYLRNILGEMYQENPQKMIGSLTGNREAISLTAYKIVELGSYEKISEYIVSEVFRRLENEKSTPKLLSKILDYADITIEQSVKDNALMYLEMRHLYIHNNGKADAKFKSKYDDIIKLNRNGKLPSTYTTTNAAIASIYELCQEIDSSLIEKQVLCVNNVLCVNKPKCKA